MPSECAYVPSSDSTSSDSQSSGSIDLLIPCASDSKSRNASDSYSFDLRSSSAPDSHRPRSFPFLVCVPESIHAASEVPPVRKCSVPVLMTVDARASASGRLGSYGSRAVLCMGPIEHSGCWSHCMELRVPIQCPLASEHSPVALARGPPVLATTAAPGAALPAPPIPIIRHMSKQALNLRAGLEVNQPAFPVGP